MIAILAALAFPAVNGAIESARKTRAKSDVSQIVTAVKAYQSEYGRLPIWSQAVDGKFENNNDLLFNILRGSSSTGEQLNMNPRRISFIEIPLAKGTKGGLGIDGKFYDPWGKPYRIWLDVDYNNEVEDFYSSGWGIQPGVAIAGSLGKNGVGLSGQQTSPDSKDDVVSF